MKFEKMYYPVIWAGLVDAAEPEVKLTQRNQWRGSLTDESMLRALGPYKLACFCERIRLQNSSTWTDLAGDLPARLHLMNKHHWPLAEVKALTSEELLLAMHDDLLTLLLNPAEAEPLRSWGEGRGQFRLIEPHLEPLPDSD